MLDWLHEALHKPPAGARITEPSPWQLSPSCSTSEFLRALELLRVDDGVLALEGTLSDKAHRWLDANARRDGLQISPGTLWPKSDWWYVPVTPNALNAFAETLNDEPPAVHLFVYQGQQVLLEWYDAFTDPLWLSRQLDGPALDQFVARVGGTLESVAQSG
jgi:hypothetical protein